MLLVSAKIHVNLSTQVQNSQALHEKKIVTWNFWPTIKFAQQVGIPKGYSSEKCLFWKVFIIPKSFILKSYYSITFYPEGSSFRNS